MSDSDKYFELFSKLVEWHIETEIKEGKTPNIDDFINNIIVPAWNNDIEEYNRFISTGNQTNGSKSKRDSKYPKIPKNLGEI